MKLNIEKYDSALKEAQTNAGRIDPKAKNAQALLTDAEKNIKDLKRQL